MSISISNDMPYDIHLSKLIKWLLNHNTVTKKWGDNVKSLRKKLSDEAKKLSSTLSTSNNDNDKLSKILSNIDLYPLTYYNCLEIFQILLKNDPSKEAKTLFGNYVSSTLSDWAGIINLFKNKNLFLADSAKILEQYYLFDLVSITKEIQDKEKEINGLNRKKINLNKSFQQFQTQLSAQYHSLEIKGINIHTELLQSRKVIVIYLEEIQLLLLNPSIERLLSYYYQFISNILHLSCDNVCPLLKSIPSYQKNDQNLECPSSLQSNEKTSNSLKFDQNHTQVSDEENPFQITLVEFEEPQKNFNELSHLVSHSSLLTKLIDNTFREELLGEIIELESFFSRMLNHPPHTQIQSLPLPPSITEDHSNISHLYQSLIHKRLHQLFLLHHSPSYISRMTDTLTRQQNHLSNLSSTINTIEKNISEQLKSLNDLYQMLTQSQAYALELKNQVAESLSVLYKQKINLIIPNI